MEHCIYTKINLLLLYVNGITDRATVYTIGSRKEK